jgi:hypothetical protein
MTSVTEKGLRVNELPRRKRTGATRSLETSTVKSGGWLTDKR